MSATREPTGTRGDRCSAGTAGTAPDRCHLNSHRRLSISAGSPLSPALTPLSDGLSASSRHLPAPNPARIADINFRYSHSNTPSRHTSIVRSSSERRSQAPIRPRTTPAGLSTHKRHRRREAPSGEHHVANPGPELLGGRAVGRHEQGVGVPELAADGFARRVEGWSPESRGSAASPDASRGRRRAAEPLLDGSPSRHPPWYP
jgi:hypothetical protein